MRLAALDSAGERLSLALGDGERVWRWRGTGAHDELLLPALERLLRRARWTPKSLDALAAASGPGRFTGIRIGMTAVSILGHALGRPVVAVSRFEALARRIKAEGPVCVILPARADREDEFFLQTFAAGRRVKPLGAPVWIKAGDLGAFWSRQPKGARLYGPCAASVAARLGATALAWDGEVGAADLLAPARERLHSGRPGPFLPIYLKPANYQR